MSRDINNKFWDEELETLPREELEKRQLADLQEIVKFAYENAPYYKRSFDEAGVKPEDIKTLKDIQKFPFINKKTQRDTQGVGSFLGELAAVPEEDVVFISTSSGSTGVPTMSPFTKKDFDEFQDTESRWFWQIGMRPNDRYVHALNFSLYVGGPDVIGAQNLGALCIWGGTLPSERLLFVLKTYQPTVIWTSPSYAWQLGEKALKSGIDPKKDLNIKKIIVAGELGGSIDATRKAIEDIWGAEVYDFYGLSDIFGACAAMCEAKDGLHIANAQKARASAHPFPHRRYRSNRQHKMLLRQNARQDPYSGQKRRHVHRFRSKRVPERHRGCHPRTGRHYRRISYQDL